MILSLVKTLYPPVAIFAVIGIIMRIRRREWRPAETVLLALLLGHNALTLFQISCFGDEFDFSRRYLIPAAPLAFGWAGYALAQLSRKWHTLRWILPILLLYSVFHATHRSLAHHYKAKVRREYRLTNHFAPIIRQDWQGPVRYEPQLWWDEYRSPRRPVIGAHLPALAHHVNGRYYRQKSSERLTPDYILSSDRPSGSWSPLSTLTIDNKDVTLWKHAEAPQHN